MRIVMLALIAVAGVSRAALAEPALIDKYHATAEEKAACSADAVRLCVHTYPDEDALVACMKVNRLQLTPRCLVVFDAGLKRRHL